MSKTSEGALPLASDAAGGYLFGWEPRGDIVPNVAEIIRDHVSLPVRCIDRLYLNAYVPRLQSSGGVVDFLVRGCGQKIADPYLLAEGGGAGDR